MSREEGLKQKYALARVDGKPTGQCIVLELKDPNTHPAIETWADTVEEDGYLKLAAETREVLAKYKQSVGKTLKAYRVTDCDWYAAYSFNEAVELAARDTGLKVDDAVDPSVATGEPEPMSNKIQMGEDHMTTIGEALKRMDGPGWFGGGF